MRKRLAPNEKSNAVGIDLFKHRAAIKSAFENGDDKIVIEGRTFLLSSKVVSNVEYIMVEPEKGSIPNANFIRSERQFSEEMSRRASQTESPRQHSRKR